MKESQGSFDLESSDRDLFELLLDEEEIAEPEPCGQLARHDLLEAPLSFSQSRLWFFEQMEPGGATYNMPGGLRIEGKLQIDALADVLLEMVRRQESLRTSFRDAGGTGKQIIDRPELIPKDRSRYAPKLVDLSGLNPTEHARQFQRLTGEEARKPFDLSVSPLYRVSLVRSHAREHVVLITMHHAISDEWSLSVFVKELSELYTDFRSGRQSVLTQPDVQYSDYAVWQREWLRAEVLDRELGYWTAALDAAPASVELPFDRPRPAVLGYSGGAVKRDLPPALGINLREMAREHGVTLFMLLLAGFEVLLFRYTGQEDFVVGTPVAGRDRVEVQGLIGFFVNMLAIRAGLSGQLSFRELCGQLKETALGAYAHQSLPFELLVERLRPERHASLPEIFNVTFVLEQGLPELTLAPELIATPLRYETRTAKFDLILYVVDSTAGMTVSFEYRTDLFDRQTIERMVGHFQVLLEAIVAAPDKQLRSLSLLTQPERHQLLLEWNNARRDFRADLCIHELFDCQVHCNPDAIALVCEDEELSYSELGARANQLANYLIRLGIGPDDLVGICVERSPSMLVGLTGILKSGAAYAPLDPAYPEDRLQFMIEDCGARVIVTQRGLVERLPANTAELVCLDDPNAPLASEALDNPSLKTASGNLAYVIYTSGSTGKPKGTMVTHGNVTRLFDATSEWYGFNELDVWSLFHSYAFDFSVWEMWGALLFGGRLIVTPASVTRSPEAFHDLLVDHRVTVLNQTPSAFRQFVDVDQERERERLANLRLVIFGGEALEPQSLRPWFERHGDARPRLVNMYGITETTVHVTYRPMVEADLAGNSGSALGEAIPDLQLLVLDEYLQLVPIGVRGEIGVGGAGTARCYLNRPDLSAARFIPNPYASKPGERMYRSGDLARYARTGDCEYLGRIDHQVKIRGFRIELAEIESVIARAEGVRQCSVVAREDWGSDKRLVAYVVPDDGELSLPALRSFVREKLPGFMVPSYFVQLDELPLTPNGKVNRRALPPPDTSDARSDEFQPPENSAQELLAAIWQELLGVDRVGRDSDFFELGGHSLLATQVASRIRESFRVELPLRRLFEHPVLYDLAEAIQTEIGVSSKGAGSPIAPSERGDSAVLSHAQERLWFLNQFEPDPAVYNIVVGVRVRGNLSIIAIWQAVGEIVRRHESLRTTFEVRHGEPVQIVHPFSFLRVKVVDLDGVSGPEILRATALAIREASRAFDLEQGPLLRITLFKVGPSDHVLAAFMHHIVSDGWSMGVFTRELTSSFSEFAGGKRSSLPELSIQYADFAIWHRAYIKSDAVRGQLDYWREKLTGAAPILEIPFDRPRPPVQTYNGATLYFDLPVELTGELRCVASRETVTLFMVLLAAFQTLLYRYSAQDDISVGSPISNRTRKEIEGLIGFFANTIVLRVRIEEGESFRSLLTRVRETTLDAYAHQDLPFEMLVEAIQPERDLSHSPLFQVLFVLQNGPQSVLDLPGLTVDPLPLDAGKAHFDLTLAMTEERGALQAAIEYNTDLFDEATVLRLIGHFEVLLSAIKRDADRRVADLPLLTQAELVHLLQDFNSTEHKLEHEAGVHQLFERQCSIAPDAVSVVLEGSHVTYEWLERRAESLASVLRFAGAAPDLLVAICVERSIEMVLGLIGILKAGAAYVPLDPAYPADRLALMMQGVNLVVTQQNLANRLPARSAQVVYLDPGDGTASADRVTNRNRIEGALVAAASSSSAPESLAYVVYTSGSTGVPKGVAMSHRAAVKMICWQLSNSKQGAGGRTLQFASLSFDVSFQEIFSTLSSGGTLVLIADDDRKDSPRLLDVISTEQVERLFVPVVAVQQLAEAAQELGRAPVALREIITAGEQLRITPQLSLLFENLDSCRLFNHYGPSETHAATAYSLPSDSSIWPEFPPIGGAIDNTSIYLLDELMNPVPLGVAGEIFIGGKGLARGYLNQPEMTAERFIPDAFSRTAGSRLYTAGDMGRYREGGTIEFLGRSDRQVKIRGYRVEPGEIETAMSQCSWIKQAVVVAGRSGSSEKRLLAYFVAEQSGEADVSNLKAILKQRLPEYMIPSVFIRLDAMPLTGSGKIDRLSLPEPDETGPGAGDSDAPFRSIVEEVVAEVYSSVLGAAVGPRDNFFDAGGNSLTATKAVSRLRSAFKVDLPLRTIFEWPAVSELALRIEEELKEGRISKGLSIPRKERDYEIPLSFAQQRIWFLSGMAPASAAYNISGAFKIFGPLDPDRLESSIREIIERHEILRTGFEEIDGRPVQKVHKEVEFNLLRRAIDGKESHDGWKSALGLASELASKTFDLRRPPLLRGLLVRLGDSEHLLALSMHHVVSDGASVEVFFRELAILYSAADPDARLQLSELKIQYADYAAWQRELLQGQVLEAEIGYWKDTLAGADEAVRLPFDRPRPPTQTFNGATVAFGISRDVEQAVRRLCRREGSTLFMTLLAAFQALLHKYGDQDDISIGIPVANRGTPETEGVIGFFVNTIVIRARIDREDSFAALLRLVRTRSLEAYAHQDVPFEKLVEELQPVRDLSRSPLFQVAFSASAPSRIPRFLGDLRVEQAEIESRTSKFDLFLAIEDGQDGLRAAVEYSSDLFDEVTVDRLARHYAALTGSLTACPDHPLREVSLLSALEIEQAVQGWNNTERPGYGELTFPDVFEGVAELLPDTVALVHGDQIVTYEVLNGRSNQLARLLVHSGIGPEQPVGICLDRSPDMIVGIIAALKSGAAFMPLDPASPLERIKGIFDDSRCSLAIAQPEVARTLAISGFRCLPADSLSEQTANYAAGNLTFKPKPESVAYLIYTSGSTGRPKGVVVEHRNLMSYLGGVISRICPRTGTSFAALSSPAADLGYTAIFPALATGGTLVIVPEDLFLDGQALADYIELHPIDVLKIVPSHLSSLQSAATPRDIMPREMLVLGGEASDAQWLTSLRKTYPGVSILNHYGPTETTVGVSTFAVGESAPETQSHSAPIGWPLANVRLYLLSEDLDPVPLGASGGLYIAGDSVSRGYFGRPDATAERFLPDVFSTEGGSRMYFSGDVARRLPDGAVEFLGRRDDQVKMRGYRIEPREIEHALLAHPDVRQVVVLARRKKGQPNSAGLSAYIVPRAEKARSIRGQNRYLLPNGMAVVHINKNETDYIYREIFELQSYLRFGTSIDGDGVIFDVGANIGLFTLFAAQLFNPAKIFAFEPNPRAFEMLKINASLYAPEAVLFEHGLGDRERTADFTFFPGFTLFSGLYGDSETEKEVVKQFISNQAAAAGLEVSDLIESSDELLNQRFDAQTFPVNLRTISDVIDENRVERIDLLKINAEKSELDVLRGIKGEHWSRIEQIVLEADLKENLSRITRMLEARRYNVNVFQDKFLSGTELYYVYADRVQGAKARRKSGGRASKSAIVPAFPSPFLSVAELKAFLGRSLPDYMIPQHFAFLEKIPLTPNGKIDRAALPDPEEVAEGRQFVPPGNSIERAIATVWQEVLGLKVIGVNDNFFTVGGNSLLVAEVCGKLRNNLDSNISVIDLFRYPTIRALAERLCKDSESATSDESAKKRGAARRRAAGHRGGRSEISQGR